MSRRTFLFFVFVLTLLGLGAVQYEYGSMVLYLSILVLGILGVLWLVANVADEILP